MLLGHREIKYKCHESLLWEGFLTPILADSSALLFPRKLNGSGYKLMENYNVWRKNDRGGDV